MYFFFYVLIFYLDIFCFICFIILYSGIHLEINYKNTCGKNRESILIDFSMFGSWVGDGATIKQIPLVNMLAMCEKVVPVVVSICDCTGHMVDGRKKDVEFVMEYCNKEDEFDPKG